jgi:hypothetical protein
VDGREAFLKIEGPWGAVMGGRTLGLFSRGNIELNAMYAHGNGVGYPCDVANFGPACGHVGFGVQYPGFTPSIRYMTPDTLGGFSFEGGMFDPVTLPGRFERTPYPRAEGELAYRYQKEEDFLHGKAWVSGTWQRMLGYNPNPTPTSRVTIRSRDPYGFSYGLRGGVGPVHAGFAGFFGKGLGITYPLENTQYPADEQLNLRASDGFYGQLMVRLGTTDLSLGYGVNRLHETEFDKNPLPMMRANVIESQRGISAGVYHGWEAVTFGVEYFRADYEWVLGNSQGVNFFNAGATFKW